MVFASLAIVVDNKSGEGLRASKGLSMLLDGDMKLLFDAGPSGEDIFFNLVLYGDER